MTVLLAKRLVEPTWSSVPSWHLTYGPAVADLAARVGRTPDLEQELILDAVFARDRFGRSVAFEIDVIASRQELKTATIEMCELGWIFVSEVGLVLHTAHRNFAVESAFRSLRKLIRSSPALSKRLAPNRSRGITTGNGSWAIEFNTEQRVDYATRTGDTGRSESVDKLVIDEAFAEDEEQSGAVIPTLGAVADPQIVRASSAGRLKSKVLRGVRDRGRAGTDPRQAYFEWGDSNAWSGCLRTDCAHETTAEGCALDDEERWAVIMPSLGGRKRVENVRAFRQSMAPKEFAHELMVWWDDPPTEDVLSAIDLAVWGQLVNLAARQPARAVVNLAVAPNRSAASIGVAGAGRKGRTLVMTLTQPGTDWVVPRLKKLMAKREILEVSLLASTQAGALVADLKAADIEFVKLTTQQAGQACSTFIKDVHAKKPRIEHVGQAELTTAAKNARTRIVGEAELWDPKNLDIDISAIVACSTAAHRWSMAEDNYDVMDSVL